MRPHTGQPGRRRRVRAIVSGNEAGSQRSSRENTEGGVPRTTERDRVSLRLRARTRPDYCRLSGRLAWSQRAADRRGRGPGASHRARPRGRGRPDRSIRPQPRRARRTLPRPPAAQAPSAEAVPADLSNPADAAALVDRAQAAIGPLDLLISNAGVELSRDYSAFTDSELEQVTYVNLIAPMVLARHALPGMSKRGRGHIVVVSSLAGRGGNAYNVLLCDD